MYRVKIFRHISGMRPDEVIKVLEDFLNDTPDIEIIALSARGTDHRNESIILVYRTEEKKKGPKPQVDSTDAAQRGRRKVGRGPAKNKGAGS